MNVVSVIISDSITPPPSNIEVSVATILAKHYKTVVEFIAPRLGYKQKTPDILMGGVMWEIKSPRGSSKYTIETQLRSALKQSRNIIIDGRSTKIVDSKAIRQLSQLSDIHNRIECILYISKESTVVEVYKKK